MVVRASELPPPRRVSDEDFDAICASFKVDRGERQALRRRLDNIVDALAKSLREGRLRPDRKADRDWLHGALKAIQKARAALPSRPGPAAEVPLNVAGAQLAYVVTVIWLLEKFPAFEKYLTPPSSNGDSPEWKSWTPPSDDLKARADFIGRETVPVLSALLGEIEIVLKIARGMIPLLPGGKGGRLPLTHRGHMIANLAQCWRSLGRRPTSGPNSSFTAFSEAVFEAIGWPTDGVQAAVPDALMLLRYHPEKIIR